MREYTLRTDGCSNTITTVCKDNDLLEMPICVAMRGRYNADGKVEQHLEPRFDGTGTTGAACRALGRKCILCESNLEYVDLIKDRLKETGDSDK